MKKILLSLIAICAFGRSIAQTQPSNYQLPYKTQTNWLRIQNLSPGLPTDSILVVSSNFRWIGKMSINDYGFINASYTGFDSRYKQFNYVPNWPEITSKPTNVSYFTNDAHYLTVESDPIWLSVASLYRTKIQNDGLYQPIGNYLISETDPIWSAVSSQYRTKIQNDALYQTLGSYLTSESDPTVSSFIKSITASSFANGNTAFSWGNHAGLYKLSSYLPPWNDIIGKPSFFSGAYIDLSGKPDLSVYYLASNPNNYISSYTETDPIWNAQKSQYSTKAISDGLYKPIGYTYTETDPIWISVQASYRTKTQNDLLYQALGNYLTAETDPIWIAQKSSYSTKVVADGLYKPLGYTPNSAEIITALGYTPVNDATSMTVNSATVGLSKATLNSTYPNVKVGYMVMCPSIVLGGAIYIKTTENGSSDVWQNISAPPAL